MGFFVKWFLQIVKIPQKLQPFHTFHMVINMAKGGNAKLSTFIYEHIAKTAENRKFRPEFSTF
jgi:hypothetical protein